WAYNVPANVESVWISALILGLIMTPSTQPHDLIGMGWAAVLAMASAEKMITRQVRISENERAT
ncbi:MAG TPA: hypothetical protein PJ988_18130, partial [Anaerolinea sp.]|nr:hypothetical protein [Anaerolinea sp.]